MKMLIPLAASLAIPASAAAAQAPVAVAPVQGTLVEIVATGKATRIPDLAIVSTGVQTQALNASDAIEQNAARMERVRAALKRAGIADKDIQTSQISLNPEYRYAQNQPPKLTGYRATNSVSVKFRDLKRTGAILDALVKEGSNRINGPSLTIEEPEEALDEARMKAIAAGRARADVYARALGMRVHRLVAISESGRRMPSPIMVAAMRADTMEEAASTQIDPGTQDLSVSVNMTFELR